MPDPDLYTTIPTDRVLITAKFFHILLAVLFVYSVGAVWLFAYLGAPTRPSGPPELGSASHAQPPTLEQLQSGTTTSPTSKATTVTKLCSMTLTVDGISLAFTPPRCVELQ